MGELQSLYLEMLHVGFLCLQRSLEERDLGWLTVELELLHNVPRLIGDHRVEGHRYFWFGERTYYLERVVESGRDDLKRRVSVFYDPVWKQMEPLLLEWFARDPETHSPDQ